MPPKRRFSRRRKTSAPSGRSAAAQNIFKKSVSKARSRGIDTRSLAQKNAALEEAQRRASEQAKGSGDNRSAYLAQQATQPIIDRNKFLMDQEQRRADILSGKITPKKSDFTGFEGGILGVRTGDFTDTDQPKIREGLTSAQYADYMRDLYDANPAMMEKMFPVASGKALRNVSRLMPGLGTLQTVAGFLGDKTGDAVQGLKQIAINKGILPNDKLDSTTGTTAVVSGPAYNPAGLEGYRDAIMRMNQSRSPLEGFVTTPQDMGITAQPGRFVQNPQDMMIAPKMTAKDYFDDLSQAEKEYVLGLRQDNPAGMLQTDPNMFTNPATGRPLVFAPIPSEVDQLRGNIPGIGSTTKMTRNMFEQLDPFTNPDVPFVPMNEGGLASINNPEYLMLRRASDFDI